MSEDLEFREAVAEDLRYMEITFLESYKNSHSAGLISMERWFEVMPVEWRSIVSRPDARACVAYDPKADLGDNDLYGYIVFLHGYKDHRSRRPLPYVVYSYTKSPYRLEHDVETGLFALAGIRPGDTFHYAGKTPSITRSYGSQAIWKPLPARYPPDGYRQTKGKSR